MSPKDRHYVHIFTNHDSIASEARQKRDRKRQLKRAALANARERHEAYQREKANRVLAYQYAVASAMWAARANSYPYYYYGILALQTAKPK